MEVSRDLSVELVFVASYAHMTNDCSTERWVYVDEEKEAADLYIMNHVKKNDIVITQDIGLASTLLLKKVSVLSPRGSLFEEKDMNTALDLRFLSAKARRRGEYGKGPKSFSREDRERFVSQLTRILSKLEQ